MRIASTLHPAADPAASPTSPRLGRTLPTKADLLSLPDDQLGDLIGWASELLAFAKAEQNRRNATSDFDRKNAEWREQTGIEPLPAYEVFAFALARQRKKILKPSKRLARASAIILQRPELFAHYATSSPVVARLLQLILGWDGETVPEQLSDWVGPRGKKKAEAEFEKVDNKLRELSQRPHQAPACLRDHLQKIEAAYSL